MLSGGRRRWRERPPSPAEAKGTSAGPGECLRRGRGRRARRGTRVYDLHHLHYRHRPATTLSSAHNSSPAPKGRRASPAPHKLTLSPPVHPRPSCPASRSLDGGRGGKPKIEGKRTAPFSPGAEPTGSSCGYGVITIATDAPRRQRALVWPCGPSCRILRQWTGTSSESHMSSAVVDSLAGDMGLGLG